MRRVLIGASIAILSARAVSAQELFDKADRETAAQLTRIVQDAESRALPTEPIVAKASLGIMMKAAPARVVTAARAEAMRLATAKEALAPSPTSAEIAAGAQALSVGVTIDALKRVRAASPREPIATPLGVLTQLVASGVTLERATSIVIDLLQRGATSVQLIALGNAVNTDIKLGGSPDNALDIRTRGLIPQIGPPGSFDFLGGDKVTVPAATTTGSPPPPPTSKPPVKKP